MYVPVPPPGTTEAEPVEAPKHATLNVVDTLNVGEIQNKALQVETLYAGFNELNSKQPASGFPVLVLLLKSVVGAPVGVPKFIAGEPASKV